MTGKQKSNVDKWLEKETEHKRKALENASKYFDGNDTLTVNTLEAVYGQESSFGIIKERRGTSDAAGHFQLEKATAEEYGLVVSEDNDQRFDIDYSSSAAARYLKDLDSMFSKETTLLRGVNTYSVKDAQERKKFVLGAYNGGQGRIARAQRLAYQKGKNPEKWDDVKSFLQLAKASKTKAEEIKNFITSVLIYEIEFTEKSPANKKMKNKEGKKTIYRCTSGHWVTIDDRPVFICD